MANARRSPRLPQGMGYDKAMDLFDGTGRTVAEIAERSGYAPATVRQCAKILGSLGLLQTGYSPSSKATTWFNPTKSIDPDRKDT